MFARLEAAYAAFKRNRAKIGGALSTGLGIVATVDPQLFAAHPRVAAYLTIAAGLLAGAGAFKSDSYQKQKQEIEAVLERNGLR